MSRFLALLFGIVGALGASQAPEFTQQYLQNLKGSVDRLTEVVARFDEDAMRSDMTRSEALNYCLTDSRPDGAMSCKGRAEDVKDFERYSQQLANLQAADEWRRPIYLVRNYDKKIAESTLEEFKPAVPATLPGAAYALAGFALFWGGAALILGLITAPFRRY
ncbi:DUF2937 family protein [Parvularcula lutaonensis]|uniref:DUF2937 family protein n=1 Tax=Parvularcula lutaonensis TaxID=491923 RepID=A0ABV7MDP7_9PROT|nr:DUF2937 family protein [Parvularcula lutaonensis]GGY53722.1 hypothetical protein GCM10007148_23790 [Parvularcula lutaonensis]